MISYEPVLSPDREKIENLASFAAAIIREHFDPIIGKEQNAYMIARFQTADSIAAQIEDGFCYYFIKEKAKPIGFLAYRAESDRLFLSKFYLKKSCRGRGLAWDMLRFLIARAKTADVFKLELTVNRHNDAVAVYEHLGFSCCGEKQTDIGGGFFMDDFIYRYSLSPDQGRQKTP